MFKNQLIYEPTHFVISGVKYKSIEIKDLHLILEILLEASYFTVGHDTISDLLDEFESFYNLYSKNNNSFPPLGSSVEVLLKNIEQHVQFHFYNINENEDNVEKLFKLSSKLGKIRERMEGHFKLIKHGGQNDWFINLPFSQRAKISRNGFKDPMMLHNFGELFSKEYLQDAAKVYSNTNWEENKASHTLFDTSEYEEIMEHGIKGYIQLHKNYMKNNIKTLGANIDEVFWKYNPVIDVDEKTKEDLESGLFTSITGTKNSKEDYRNFFKSINEKNTSLRDELKTELEKEKEFWLEVLSIGNGNRKENKK